MHRSCLSPWRQCHTVDPIPTNHKEVLSVQVSVPDIGSDIQSSHPSLEEKMEMKKLAAFACAILLGASLSLAQPAGGSSTTDHTTTAPKTHKKEQKKEKKCTHCSDRDDGKPEAKPSTSPSPTPKQ